VKASARVESGAPALHDIIWLIYCLVILALLIVPGAGFGRVEHAGSLIGVHLAILAAGLGARFGPRLRDNPLTRFLRWWYPTLMILFCFEALGHMIHIIRPELIDDWLMRADRFVFGAWPTLVLQRLARPWLTELSYICYTSFYLYIPAVGLPLWLRAQRTRSQVGSSHGSVQDTGPLPDAGPESGSGPGIAGSPFAEFMAAVTLVMYGCFLHFLLTPGGGPVFWPAYPGEVLHLTGGPVTALEQWLFDNGTIVGGAFPSSHVALAVTAAFYAVRHRIVPWLFIPLTIGLGLSTMYNGYHYGVDVLYGLVVAVVVIVLTPRLMTWWEKSFESDPE